MSFFLSGCHSAFNDDWGLTSVFAHLRQIMLLQTLLISLLSAAEASTVRTSPLVVPPGLRDTPYFTMTQLGPVL